MFVRCIAALLLTSGLLMAQELSLVRVGASWRYFKGVSEPSNPVEAWRALDFDDQSWAEGISGFSNGYGGEYDEATRFPDFGISYGSFYARRRFEVADPAAVKWLVLRIDFNDGFVAYLNGIEVARRNIPGLPGTTAAFDSKASECHARGLIEEINLQSFAPLLKTGANALAVQVLGQVQGTTACDFDFVLSAELVANFTRGPIIQNLSTNRVTVVWKTPLPGDAVVEYGTTPDFGQSASAPELTVTHALILQELIADTVYYYRVRSRAGESEATSATATFRTFKNSGPISFAVFGDTGSGSLQQHLIADQIRKAQPDLVLHVGDIIYPLFTTNSTVDLRCFSVYQPQMKSVPYFFAIGNHDLYAGDAGFLNAFYLPTNSVTRTEHFYSFDHGDAHFIVLLQPYANQYLLTPDNPIHQYEWLVNDLAGTTKPWKFVFMHVPMITSGAHRFDDLAHFGTPDSVDIRNTLLPVLSKYGVQMVFAGHDHNYERFNPVEGVHSVVTGGGGVALRYLAALDAASSQFMLTHHFTKVVVDSDQLRFEAINTEGEVFDSMVIRRTVPAKPVFDAAWGTPDVDGIGEDDLDGNINGQSFDVAGESIAALPGRFSNMGQVHVSNDYTNLYIGFEQAMIYGNQNIFLFIESPKATGVTNMVGVGNGLIDPLGQGADALDFVENLSFTNFTPRVGILLGDEFGDRQSRSFSRSNLPLNIGQGAFFLGPELGDVPGVRLQQFNRSPQAGGIPGEENANFIKVSIPLIALGGLRSGDAIKLGAVVGMSGYDTNATKQTRQLDSGFLGHGLRGSGQDPVVLEGVGVKLAFNPDGDDDNDGLRNADELARLTDPHNPDTDGDGLLDGWETAHNLDPRSGAGIDGAEGDPDGDGYSNAREQVFGTDPRDPRSAVRLELAGLGEDRYRFTWPTVEGKQYVLEVAENLAAEFKSVSATDFPIRATSTNQTYSVQLPPAPPSPGREFFFRIRLIE
ncbi:MAG: hypothetical protein EXS31_12350 [Pedosphaera sp.]|nr:hypothetical protein [Pedosphaera sp.]